MQLPARLQDDEVHVWAVDLAPSRQRLCFYQNLLSPAELKRASRFHRDTDRHAWMVARGFLRHVLGHYAECAPRDLPISVGEHGKPQLSGRRLDFSMSHSRGVGLLAIARNCSVGVDVEWIDPSKVTDRFARHCFSRTEYRHFKAVERQLRTRAFFNGWTRKEAFIKALGQGLNYPLSDFDVSLKPEAPARLIRIEGSASKAMQWTMHNTTPCRAYAGAVVAGGRGWKLACFVQPREC